MGAGGRGGSRWGTRQRFKTSDVQEGLIPVEAGIQRHKDTHTSTPKYKCNSGQYTSRGARGPKSRARGRPKKCCSAGAGSAGGQTGTRLQTAPPPPAPFWGPGDPDAGPGWGGPTHPEGRAFGKELTAPAGGGWDAGPGEWGGMWGRGRGSRGFPAASLQPICPRGSHTCLMMSSFHTHN